MKRIVQILAAVAAVSLVYATAPGAEPAQPPAQKTDPKAKVKAKKEAPQVEGSYASEADAKKNCGSDPVVWVNTNSKIYHAAGTRDYGKTKRGFYMCQPRADKSGFRPVKGKAPKK
jgi:hypothetical protein